jgi:phenylacetic acid degradation operon negative regulatory protein
MITYGLELCSASYSSKGAGEAYARAVQQLAGVEEKKTIYRLKDLKKGGFVRYKRGLSDIETTEAGRKRLRRSVPVYEKRRKWGGRLYLITYDIPESKKLIRDYFREHLKALGCGMLQASVWITPYDPREVLRKFIRYNRLEGEVLISYAGRDSNVAGTDFRGLMRQVYHLDELNKRYTEFLESPLEKWPRYRVAVAYYSILKDDPQLPFELLPDDWKGDEAYEKFSRV